MARMLRQSDRHTRLPLRALDPVSGLMPVGVDEDGRIVSLCLRDQAGMVVGGAPGSGKTVGVKTVVLSLLLSEHANLHVIDGKGGGDWAWTTDQAIDFADGATDEEAETVIAPLHEQMCERLRGMRPLYGNANWWNCDPNDRPPLEVLLIDECQVLFDPRIAPARQSRRDRGTSTALVSDLIRRGRAAGILTILITQKPTADSIPTGIRDNCGIRICFRVLTAEARRAVLGDTPAGSPDPTEIPASRPGGAVITGPDGRLTACRFANISDEQAELLLRSRMAGREARSDSRSPTGHRT